MNVGEQIFTAMSYIGLDLVDTAEQKRYAPTWGRQLLSAAACLALILGTLTMVWKLQSPEAEPPVYIAAEAPAEMEPPVTDEPAALPLTKRYPLYILDQEGMNLSDPVKVLDSDGNVLYEADFGMVRLLQDSYSGEYIGFYSLIYDSPEAPHSEAMEVYDLEGNLVQTLENVTELEILNDMAVITETRDGKLYGTVKRHTDGAVLWEGPEGASVRGQYIVSYQNIDGNSYYDVPEGMEKWVVIDAYGTICEIDTTFESYPRCDNGVDIYFPKQDRETGKWGLVDGSGKQVTAPRYTRFIDLQDNFSHWEDGSDHVVTSLLNGEEIFRSSEYTITHIYQDYFLAENGQGSYLLDRDGAQLYSSPFPSGIAVIGNPYSPEGFLIQSQEEHYEYRSVSGHAAGTYYGRISRVSDHIILLMQEDESLMIDLTSGEELAVLPAGYQMGFHLRNGGWPSAHDDPYTGYVILSIRLERQEQFDLYWEDGTLIRSDLGFCNTVSPGALYVSKDGIHGLMAYDGTWIYQEHITDSA